MAWRIYISDAVMAAANNAARIGGGQTVKRWSDLIEKAEKPVDRRPPEEVIADVAQKAGLIITHG